MASNPKWSKEISPGATRTPSRDQRVDKKKSLLSTLAIQI